MKHVLWDWNGTLLDDVSAVVKSLNSMLRPRGLRRVSCREYREVFRFPVRDYYVELGFDFKRDDWNRVAADFRDLYLKNARLAPLRRGAIEALKYLRDRGIPMSILSASESSVLEEMVGQRRIRHFFSGLYGLPDHFAESKVETARGLMAGLGTEPSELLLIGDTMHDYEVAMELKCRCLLVYGGHQSEHRLRQCKCDIVPDIEHVVEYVSRQG